MSRKWRRTSTVSPSDSAWPDRDVPPERRVRGQPSWLEIDIATATSCAWRARMMASGVRR